MPQPLSSRLLNKASKRLKNNAYFSVVFQPKAYFLQIWEKEANLLGEEMRFKLSEEIEAKQGALNC
jgi:nucleoside permease NupC